MAIRMLRCRCLRGCPNGELNGTCLAEIGGYCFSHTSMVRDDNGDFVQEHRLGCLPGDLKGFLQCKGNLVPHDIPQKTICCSKKDYCNDDQIYSFDEEFIKTYDYENKMFDKETFSFEDYEIYIYILSTILAIAILLAFLCLYILHRRKKATDKEKELDKKLSKSNNSMEKINYHFDTSFKPLLVNPDAKRANDYSRHDNLVNQRPPAFNRVNNSSISDSGSSTIPYKYLHLNNSNSSHTNGSNFTINFRNFSSTASNTTSSMASDITQQTTLSSQKPPSSLLPPLDENSVTSGSGSGHTHLVQQTLAREIRLQECIGHGRYGNVWLGIRKCENLAVKIFFSRDEASWKREIEIYTTVIMRQDNILGFSGADVTSQNGCTELWLVTEYCPMGSLFDYLSRRPLASVEQLLMLMQSIIDGLSHLHTEIIGTRGKPAIAHRDIKSKNILMKSDNTCCIADFGLAVIKSQTAHIDIAQNHRVGTRRYMAPEILNEKMRSDMFKSFCLADIYSLSLVFWELFNRLQLNGLGNEYHVPFYDLVSSDPSFDDMRQVVCLDQKRPQFNQPFLNNGYSLVLDSIMKLIQECWLQNPDARLTSLRIKKSIRTLISQNSE